MNKKTILNPIIRYIESELAYCIRYSQAIVDPSVIKASEDKREAKYICNNPDYWSGRIIGLKQILLMIRLEILNDKPECITVRVNSRMVD